MYVLDSAACSLPNSATPMSPERIRRQDQRMSAAGAHFVAGNDALNGIIGALGGNPVDAPYGNAGVPTIAGPPYNPYTNLPSGLSVRGQNGAGGAGAGDGSSSGAGTGPCVFPEVLPLVTIFPIPAVTKPTPGPGPASSLVDREFVPPPVPTPAARTICDNVTPDNVCELARAGCFSPGQLSPEQLYACSWAGWAGNYNQFHGGAAGGRIFGSLNLCPKNPRGETMPCPPNRGVSGTDVLTGPGSSALWGSLALLGFALWGASAIDKQRRAR